MTEMKIKACKCQHAAQDAFYGPGQRAKVPAANGDLRCTVCGETDKHVVTKKEKEKK